MHAKSTTHSADIYTHLSIFLLCLLLTLLMLCVNVYISRVFLLRTFFLFYTDTYHVITSYIYL